MDDSKLGKHPGYLFQLIGIISVQEKIMETTLLSQYLTFRVDQEHFALSVSHVREVLEYNDVTKVPRMPDFMCGVINLRGSVVPVIDLRLKFGLSKGEVTVETSIVVVEIEWKDEMVVMGLLTDSVEAVIEIAQEDVQPAPQMGTKVDTSFIQGMGKIDENFIILLNITRLLSGDEILKVAEQQQVKEDKEVQK
jgi:purine-binding chemotaxis protein CheW